MTVAAFSGFRVAQALASSVLGQIIQIAQNYLLVPLFLSAWGDEGYGQWLSLTALASYLSLLDLGGQSFVGNQLAEAFAQERPRDFQKTLREGFSLFVTATSLAQLLVSLVLLWPGLGWDRSARLIVFWSSISVALSVPAGVLVTCYPATGRVVRSTSIGNVSRLLTLVISCLALRAHVKQVDLALTLFGFNIIATAVIMRDLRRQLGGLFVPRLSLEDLRKGVRLLRGSLDYWLFSLAGALNLQGILLVLAFVHDNASVAQFATHRSAASLTVYLGSLLRPALWTEMTFMAARGDTARLRDVVSVAVRTGTWCAAVAGSTICLAAPFGYALWTRSKLELNVPLLLLLTTQAVLSAAWNTASWPLMSAGRPRALARWSVLNAILTVAGAYVGLRAGWGVWCVAAASLAADVVCGLIPFPMTAAAFLTEPVSRFAKDLIRALLCALPFATVAYLSIRFCETNVVRALVFGGASLLLAWPAMLALLGKRDLNRIRMALTKR
ncbi:MAG: hypothetical protein JWN04_2687 [Myxococcaceae bacterium]|nr:hypothetical protein [Myxococcaceae bacterium]